MKIKLLIIAFFCYSLPFLAQVKVTTKLKTYSMCPVIECNPEVSYLNREAGTIIVFAKVDVTPGKSIKLYAENNKTIEAIWDPSKLKFNKTHDLFIYGFFQNEGNNNEGHSSLQLVMRMNYSVQALVSTAVRNGNLFAV